MNMTRLALALLLSLAIPGASAQGDDRIDRLTNDSFEVIELDRLAWQPEPSLPEGAESVLLAGDPSTAGMFVVRIRMPANYRIGPHTHPFVEMITVISGSAGNGLGETYDEGAGRMLKAGDSFILPAEAAHYVWTEEEGVIVDLIATGPWGITYLDPADDPRL